MSAGVGGYVRNRAERRALGMRASKGRGRERRSQLAPHPMKLTGQQMRARQDLIRKVRKAQQKLIRAEVDKHGA